MKGRPYAVRRELERALREAEAGNKREVEETIHSIVDEYREERMRELEEHRLPSDDV